MATYAAKRVQCSYGPVGITGYAEGSFVKVTQTKETFAPSMGSDGEGCFVQDADLSGMMEFTLHHASPANAALMALANEQAAGTKGPQAAIIRDLNGSYLGECVGYLSKPADTERANTTSNMAWKVVALKVDQSGGGVTTL
jgi:hypothetical protein